MTDPRILAKGHPFGAWLRWPRLIRHTGTSNEHLHCLGSSGTGKTRFLYYLAAQDVQRTLSSPGSCSTAVVDPHGDLAAELVGYIAQLSKKYPLEDRVIIIEPTNQLFGAVGINFLEVFPGMNSYETVDETVGVFNSIWAASTGPRMSDIIRMSALLLQENNLTLANMLRLITDEPYRKALLRNSTNEDVNLFWNVHFGGLKEIEKRNYIESTRNKLSAFLSNPFIRPILAQRISTINFYKELNRGVVVIINLSRAHLKTESRRLLGTLIFSKIHQAVLARNDLDEKSRTPTSVFIDECHEVFFPEAHLNLLEGGRKYKVSLNMFHQSLSQLLPSETSIILNNCATLACFGVGRRDAEIMSKEMFSFSGQKVKYQEGGILLGKKGKPGYFSVQEEQENAIQELMKQGVGEVYIKLKGRKNSNPFIATTLPVQYPPRDPEAENEVRKISAQHYNRRLDEIYREYEERDAEIIANNTISKGGDAPMSFRE
jgi:hypothetical protein